MNVINPSNEEVMYNHFEHSKDEVLEMLDKSESTYKSWRNTKLQKREDLLSNVSYILENNKRKYAEIMTKEMGKPISQSVSEIEKCAWVCDHYAENAGSYLSDSVHPSPPGIDARTVYQPLGTVLAVMPWNFPFWQVFRFAAPYLTAGNVGILKHASNVPKCATSIEEIFDKAGYPNGCFQSLIVGSDMVDDIIADNRVKAVTITGSGPAGSAVASTAGEEIKKSVLELGGSDPFVILEDADLEEATETAVWARNQNSGQSCIAGKRFIVTEDIYDEFVEMLVEKFEKLEIGDPMNKDTDIGPQASEDLMMNMHNNKIKPTIEAGANVLTGGKPMDRKGFYYPPTILTNVPKNCPADEDEIFGPVASVYKVSDKDKAVEKANDTMYGLGASVWTKDTDKARNIADEIDAGCVYINELVKSDPRVPFGGVGISGYGRELSEVGIKEFTNKKTIWVDEDY